MGVNEVASHIIKEPANIMVTAAQDSERKACTQSSTDALELANKAI